MILSETTAESGIIPFVYGSETEVAINLLDDEHTDVFSLIVDLAADNDPSSPHDDLWATVSGNMPKNSMNFIESGGRLYLDGEHLEITTPECLGLYELVVQELAAEQTALRALRWFVDQGRINGFQLNKRSSDHEGNLWGAHENCSTTPNVVDYEDRELQQRLNAIRLTHQLTRVIYTGEGGLMLDTNNNLRFVISPRVASCTGLLSDSTITYPLVCSNYKVSSGARLQNCAGANISPWAIAVKHGMNAVLSLLAADPDCDIVPLIEKPNQIQSSIAGGDITAHKQTFVDHEGNEWTAPSLQRYIAELVLRAYSIDRFELAEDEIWTCEQVVKVCDDLERTPDSCADRIDYLKRWQDLQRTGLPKTPFSAYKFQSAQNADFGWDTLAVTDTTRNVHELAGAGVRARSGGWGWYDMDQATTYEIDRARRTPPATRAAERVDLLRQGYTDVDYRGCTELPLYDAYGNNIVYLG